MVYGGLETGRRRYLLTARFVNKSLRDMVLGDMAGPQAPLAAYADGSGSRLA